MFLKKLITLPIPLTELFFLQLVSRMPSLFFFAVLSFTLTGCKDDIRENGDDTLDCLRQNNPSLIFNLQVMQRKLMANHYVNSTAIQDQILFCEKLKQKKSLLPSNYLETVISPGDIQNIIECVNVNQSNLDRDYYNMIGDLLHSAMFVNSDREGNYPEFEEFHKIERDYPSDSLAYYMVLLHMHELVSKNSGTSVASSD